MMIQKFTLQKFIPGNYNGVCKTIEQKKNSVLVSAAFVFFMLLKVRQATTPDNIGLAELVVLLLRRLVSQTQKGGLDMRELSI